MADHATTQFSPRAPTHTPGPWSYDPMTGCIHGGAATILRPAGLSPADGHLLAAAPDLLDALQEAIELIVYWHGDMLTEHERNHPRGSGPARVYDKAIAAIAKAMPASNETPL